MEEFKLHYKCKKCNGAKIELSFKEEVFQTEVDGLALTRGEQEHLVITCKCCGYAIKMKCADAD